MVGAIRNVATSEIRRGARETWYRNRKWIKKGGDGKCSLETLSTLHADGHRFGKTKWRAVAKDRTKKGTKGGGGEGERAREKGEESG